MGKLVGIAKREKKRAPMETLEIAELGEQTGVNHDFRGKPGKRQVTVLSADVWKAVCEELGENLPWTTRRANLLVEGLELPCGTGDIIEIGRVALLVTMETDPCSRMDEQCAGLKKALQPDWRGGVACRILSGGSIRIGDTVSLRSN
ncbi:MAG: MOSC domain-containing protein [Gammaproteobacteria bacterium]|nr:MOSC domain-containing protein [Gammaproteobacteria bacterium]